MKYWFALITVGLLVQASSSYPAEKTEVDENPFSNFEDELRKVYNFIEGEIKEVDDAVKDIVKKIEGYWKDHFGVSFGTNPVTFLENALVTVNDVCKADAVNQLSSVKGYGGCSDLDKAVFDFEQMVWYTNSVIADLFTAIGELITLNSSYWRTGCPDPNVFSYWGCRAQVFRKLVVDLEGGVAEARALVPKIENLWKELEPIIQNCFLNSQSLTKLTAKALLCHNKAEEN